MSEKRKVTNYYKVLLLILSYKLSLDYSSKFDVPKISGLPIKKPLPIR